MGKQIAKPGTGRPKRPKRTVEVSDGVRVVMAGLTQAEKDTIEAAFRSAAAIRRLPVELVVRPPDGEKMYTARVTDDLRLIYTIGPERIHVVLLMSAEAIEYWRGVFGGSGANGKPTP